MDDCSLVCIAGFRQQALAHAKLTVRENGTARDQEGPGGLYPGGGLRGGSQQLREPTEDQPAHTGIPQHGDKGIAKGGPHSTKTKDPTLPENHSGSCASQEGMLGAGATLCIKNFIEGCQQALATEKHVVHRGTVLRGKASSYLHQSWTVGRQDRRDHFSPPPVMQDPCNSSGEGTHEDGRRCREVPAEAGE
ncbi:hypothetical protein NDU88_001084 [Pleurodeles waltl]|uniref:Uncharacterized protein n=1 Tax=Pleurodeles waltl TaxID=8319 RepID=A0AAV7MRT0_PLEWA|nr:hypothetical protein NDU88_001084 [Pleurodeles waltl]